MTGNVTREELHRTFGGYINEVSFDTSRPSNTVKNILSAWSFDYTCVQYLKGRSRRADKINA